MANPGTNTPVSASRFTKYWMPVILWMAIIFSASTGAGSTKHTSRIIGPILRWFNPDTSDETIQSVQFVIRKTAHMAEYALLAALLWRARRNSGVSNPLPTWDGSHAMFAISIAAVYAISDEVHQAFVPSRQGSIWDVLLDTIGAALGIFCIWIYCRIRYRWR